MHLRNLRHNARGRYANGRHRRTQIDLMLISYGLLEICRSAILRESPARVFRDQCIVADASAFEQSDSRMPAESGARFEFPSATQALRTRPRHFARLTALPRNSRAEFLLGKRCEPIPIRREKRNSVCHIAIRHDDIFRQPAFDIRCRQREDILRG